MPQNQLQALAPAEMGQGGFNGQFVALGAEAAYDTGGDVGKMRMAAERLARMNVREMHFDKGDGHRRECVAQGDAGVRVTRRIDDDKFDTFRPRALYPVDQFSFVIALEAFKLNAGHAGTCFHGEMNVCQSNPAVNFWLATAEQVQVGPMEYENPHRKLGFPLFCFRILAAGWLRHAGSLPQITALCPVLRLYRQQRPDARVKFYIR